MEEEKELLYWKREELLSLPKYEGGELPVYDSILLVPTKKKHDSGFRLFCAIGCKSTDNGCFPCEIVSYMDDLNLFTAHVDDYSSSIRMDMILSNCIHIWSYKYDFMATCMCDSTDIKMVLKVSKDEEKNY